MTDGRQALIPGTGESDFAPLLEREIRIRDPIHKDIWITKLEKELIDEERFQRLKRIRQLGITNLVYPSANHTRFCHSLGTLSIAQEIIDSVNKNAELQRTADFEHGIDGGISPEDVFTTRLVALLHDLAHLPFGHTLEDQGNLYESQWRDGDRRTAILGDVTGIIESRMEEHGFDERTHSTICTRIERTLRAEENGDDAEEEGRIGIRDLDRSYIADIVGNTICADLLDYVKRDAYFTGIDLAYDPHILSQFVLVEDPEIPDKKRLGILIEKPSGELHRSVVSDCIDLLRHRYSLAEKVHYDRSKLKYSAPIIRAVYCAREAGLLDKDHLLSFDDDALLHYLEGLDGEEVGRRSVDGASDADDGRYPYDYPAAASNLAKKVLRRESLEVAYEPHYGYHDIPDSIEDADQRDVLVRYLEQYLEADPGSIIVYAPGLETGKAAEAKMLHSDGVVTLQNLPDEYDSEFGHKNDEFTSLEDGYKKLWGLYVFIEENLWSGKRKEWGMSNDEIADVKEAFHDVCEQFIVEEEYRPFPELRYRIKKHKEDEVIGRDELVTIKGELEKVRHNKKAKELLFIDNMDRELEL